MDPVIVATSTLLGLLAGSFANVAIHRWPRGGSVVTPAGSSCPACGHPVRWYDNVPVASWLVLVGRCRDCGTSIPARYPIVEVTTGLLWAAVAWTTTASVDGFPVALPVLLAFTWVLVVAAAIDLGHRIIPNRLTLRSAPLLALLLTVATAADGTWTDLRRGLVAAVALPAVMLALSEGFRLLRGRVGIGMGDIKLAVSIGLVVGYLGGWHLVVWFYATTIGAVAVVAILLVSGRANLATRIPYGPYLALGALVAVLGGDRLVAALRTWFLGA